MNRRKGTRRGSIHAGWCGLLAGCVVLAGCATTTGPGTLGDLNYDYKERKIINQARGTGAVVGGAAGYAIARNNSRRGASRVGGALLGGLVGAAVGDAVGTAQANKAREKRLDNEALGRMITETRANNERLVRYNRRVAARIVEIRKAEAAERAKLAKAELPAVNRAIERTDGMIRQNEADRSLLAGSQRGELDRENRKAKSERATLAKQRDELAAMAAM